MYSQDLIDSVLKNSDIVSVISSFIPVTKKGRSYVALCPFHDDKNPSLSISKEKQIFKCFVCGTGGNAIGFVEKYLKIPFMEAVRKVAEISGYHDPRLTSEAPQIKVDEGRKRLLDCINDLAAFYRYSLSIPEGEKAREYLQKRNLDAQQQAKYQIGYAPLDGQTTIKFLQAKGHSLKAIDDIGIALAKTEGTSDHNAGRLIFPLWDPKGQVVGFSARQLEKDGTSKYINTSETPLFHKGSILYNYHNVAVSARRDGYCYLLEGFMDVMALEKAGLPNAVALMGTSLTPDQVNLLRRLGCEIRIGLDGDNPGQVASMKAATMLSKAGLPVRIVDYQGDLRDPDDILQQEGGEALKARMERLLDPIDFALAYYTVTKRLESSKERQALLERFLPYLRSKPAGIEFEDTLVKVAEATSYKPEAIRELLRQNEGNVEPAEGEEKTLYRRKVGRGRSKEAYMLDRLYAAERMLLFYMMHEPEAIEFYNQSVGNFHHSLYEEAANYIIEYRQSKGQDTPDIDVSALLGFVDGYGGEEAEPVEKALSSLAFEKSYPPYDKEVLESCLRTIKEESDLAADKMKAKREVDQGSLHDGAAANKELADKIREKWNKKGA